MLVHSAASTAGRAPAAPAPRRAAAAPAARAPPPPAAPTAARLSQSGAASSRRGLLLGLIATAGAASAAPPRPALAADAKKAAPASAAAAAPKSLADLPRAQFEGLADPDGDGKVTLEELRAFSKQLAEAESLPAPDEKQLSFTARLYDLNSDGTLGTEELLRRALPHTLFFFLSLVHAAAIAHPRSPPLPLSLWEHTAGRWRWTARWARTPSTRTFTRRGARGGGRGWRRPRAALTAGPHRRPLPPA